MPTAEGRDAILTEIEQRASEAPSVEALGLAVMPEIERLLDASSSVFYRINEQGHVVPLAGTLVEAGYRYSRDYYAADPLQAAMREHNAWVFNTDRAPSAWRTYIDGPVYSDLCRHYDIHTFLHTRLVDGTHGAPGMYGIMTAHGEHQAPFSARDELDLMKLLPMLVAAVRRNAVSGGRGSGPLLEAALESGLRPALILDGRGGLLWISRRASEIFGWNKSTIPRAPPQLADAALKMGRLIAGDAAAVPPRNHVRLRLNVATPVTADLRLVRPTCGPAVIVAEIETAATPPSVQDLERRFPLTRTQALVLASLARGLSDQSIARRHSISVATVRSHVSQIFARLGVRSRVQAALLAIGIEPDDVANDGGDPERPS